MQKSVIIILFLVSNLFAAAQKPGKSSYNHTEISGHYFTDAEIDKLVYEETALLLRQHGIPEQLIKKNYADIRYLLLSLSQENINQSFKALEKERYINDMANKRSTRYKEARQEYTIVFRKQIRNIFLTNSTLLQYLSVDNNDRITYFNSTVRIGTDGKLLVEENITVYNGNGEQYPVYRNDGSLPGTGDFNDEIKRGIVRTFPLYYVNRNKLFQNTSFDLKEVWRDGEREDYHTEKQENGIALYLGNSDVFLKPGTYRYRIIYETDHQLKMLKDFDELYWNVTGNGWSFRIDSASCTVILPKDAHMLSGKCYTGSRGATDAHCNMTSTAFGDSSVIIFKTTKPLPSYQGITIAVSWQKGIVSGPSAWQKMRSYFWDNKAVFLLPFAALFSAVFCFIFWYRYGRDPKKGVIYPQFAPPAGFSPAALGYIISQHFNQQLTAATIVDAAVNNKIKIDVKREGLIIKHNAYVISKSNEPAKPGNYEAFENEVEKLIGTRIEKGKYNSELGTLNTKVKDYCYKNYKNKDGTVKKNYTGFFALNNSYTILPILVCLAAAVWGFIDGVLLALQLSNFWQLGYFIAGFILCAIVLRFFAKLLTAYSPEGRLLADKIEGFRMFLSTTDEQRFDQMNPAERSLELYEKYLPFAIALDCEIEWGKKFEDIINTAIVSGSAASSFSKSYQSGNQNFSWGFASSFSGAISSASSPPSSSSGGGSSFGGGSSGGGGGGGEGGGW